MQIRVPFVLVRGRAQIRLHGRLNFRFLFIIFYPEATDDCSARLRKKDPGALIADVCACVAAKLKAGDYDNLKFAVEDPWRRLIVADKAQVQEVDSLDSQDEPQLVIRKRHDLDSILRHFRQHGPTGTFCASVCQIDLDTGSQARLAYVLPKYHLDHAQNRKQEMSAALRLALATSEVEVQHAAASIETGQSLRFGNSAVHGNSTAKYLVD